MSLEVHLQVFIDNGEPYSLYLAIIKRFDNLFEARQPDCPSFRHVTGLHVRQLCHAVLLSFRVVK